MLLIRIHLCWHMSPIVAYSCYDDFDNDDDLITWYKSTTRNNVKSEKKMEREKWEWWNGVSQKMRRQSLKKTYLGKDDDTFKQLDGYQIVVLAIWYLHSKNILIWQVQKVLYGCLVSNFCYIFSTYIKVHMTCITM